MIIEAVVDGIGWRCMSDEIMRRCDDDGDDMTKPLNTSSPFFFKKKELPPQTTVQHVSGVPALVMLMGQTASQRNHSISDPKE